MKRLLLIMLLVPFLAFAQKVKIKKDNVIINKKEVGTVVKTKDSLGKKFTYSNIDGNVLATYTYKFEPSLIEGDDDGYYYTQISFPEYDLVNGIPFDETAVKFSLQTRKSFVKNLAKMGYINEAGEILEDAVRKDFSGPALPELITAYFELEEEQMQHLDYIHERDMSASVIIKKGAGESVNKRFLGNAAYSTFYFQDYKIFQGEEIIGRVKLRYNTTANLGAEPGSPAFKKSPDPKIYFFNNEGGRVAWSHGLFHDLKVHNGGKRLDKRSSKFLATDNDYERVAAISRYLVEQGKL